MLKESLNTNTFICEDAVAGFLVSVRLGGGRQNRCCRLTEEPHQSLDVLSYRCEEELLAYEPESPQRQTPQSDLILQFCEQGFRLFSLPLRFGELQRVNQLPRTLSGWFVLVDDKTPEGSAGALWSEQAGITAQVGFHTLRRTLASALVANGNDVRLVQELLRHSNPLITLDAYARSTTPAKIAAQGWVMMQQLLTEDSKAALAAAKPASTRTM